MIQNKEVIVHAEFARSHPSISFIYDFLILQTPESSSIIVSIEICVRERISEGSWNDFGSLLFFPEYALTKVSPKAMMKLTKKVSKESEVTLMSRLPFRPRIAEETKQKIVDLYKNDESLTCEKIARICKVSKSSVFRTLKNSSIDRRGKGRTSVTYYCVEPLRDLLAS